jgi:hypothetical protein
VKTTLDESQRNQNIYKGLQDAGVVPNSSDSLEKAVNYYAHMDCLEFNAK